MICMTRLVLDMGSRMMMLFLPPIGEIGFRSHRRRDFLWCCRICRGTWPVRGFQDRESKATTPRISPCLNYWQCHDTKHNADGMPVKGAAVYNETQRNGLAPHGNLKVHGVAQLQWLME